MALLSHRADGLGINGGTSGAIDTTGATIIFVAVGYDTRSTSSAPTDSQGNTGWTSVGSASAAIYEKVQLWYCTSPSTSATHTFSFGGAGGFGDFASIAIAAFDGISTISPLDQQNSATGTGISTLATGSITPTVANELVITACAVADSTTANAINGGFTPSGADATYQASAASFVRDGISIAYLIQTSATAANPTWTASASTAMSAIIASFKAASGGGSSLTGTQAETATPSDSYATAQKMVATEAESTTASDTYATAQAMLATEAESAAASVSFDGGLIIPLSQAESASASASFASGMALAAQEAESTAGDVLFACALAMGATQSEGTSPVVVFDNGTTPGRHTQVPFYPWWYRLQPLNRRRIM